tara:strand:+ start:1422 stop:1760 length:339 start_codon:yes stop_codon:yes gene_type:complete
VKTVTVRTVTVGKAFAYFFVGFFSALVVIELTDGKPAKKVNYYRHDYYRVRYIYEPYPFTRTYNQIDTFNNRRPHNNSGGYNRSSGEKRTNTGTKTFDHTPQQRTESWGTKN